MRTTLKVHKNIMRFLSRKSLKQYLVLLAIIAFAVVLAVTSSETSTAQTQNVDSKTLFKVNIAYAYVANHEGSYYDSATRFNMSTISQYPTEVIFNITRTPDFQTPSCDAIVEVYGVHFVTEKGLSEDYAYLVGTNCNPQYLGLDLTNFTFAASKLIDRSVYLGIKGDIRFHWLANTSVLSETVGSICSYSNVNSSLGLWTDGKPSQISINVERLGYATVNNGIVSIYKDQEPINTVSASLSNYGDGFIINNVLPASSLTNATVWDPIPIQDRMPSRK
jgi:hypothetical protein